MKKKFAALLFALVMALALVPSMVLASAEQEDVTVSKTATPVEGMVNAWNIDLTVNAKVKINPTPGNDVVLVLDNSNSMYNPLKTEQKWVPGPGGWGGRYEEVTVKTRMDNAKLAAKAFLDQLLPDGNTVNRVGIVVFNSEVPSYQPLTNDKAVLAQFIDGVNQDLNGSPYTPTPYKKGGTYLQAGIEYAANMLKNAASSANVKSMVLLSDGAPTYARINDVVVGNGKDYESRFNAPTVNAAKNSGATVYSVGLSAGEDGEAVLKDCASDGAKFFAVKDEGDVSGLVNVFSAIVGDMSTSCKKANVVDKMAQGFVVNGKVRTANGTATVSADGKTINWNIGDVSKPVNDKDGSLTGYTAQLSYTVYLDDGIYTAESSNGLYPTNASAVLTYGNAQTVNFETPEVYVTGVYLAKFLVGGESGTFKVSLTNKASGNLWRTDELTAIPVSEDTTEEQIVNDLLAKGVYIAQTVPAGEYTAKELVSGTDYNVYYYTAALEDLEKDCNPNESDTFNLQNGKDAVVMVFNEKVLPETEMVSISVTKVWDDGNSADRPASVKVQLLANGEPCGEPVELSADNDWTYVWEVAHLDADGKEITYTVKELSVPDGYEAAYTSGENGTLVITNKLKAADPTPTTPDKPTAEETGDGFQMWNYAVLAVLAVGGTAALVLLPNLRHGKREER